VSAASSCSLSTTTGDLGLVVGGVVGGLVVVVAEVVGAAEVVDGAEVVSGDGFVVGGMITTVGGVDVDGAVTGSVVEVVEVAGSVVEVVELVVVDRLSGGVATLGSSSPEEISQITTAASTTSPMPPATTARTRRSGPRGPPGPTGGIPIVGSSGQPMRSVSPGRGSKRCHLRAGAPAESLR